ncbi:MAG TPA: FxLYD domain-containing protein [Methylomirabilota bacterium]|nr:FxLYD domain-containing protein [Methylomirabilota bacterium]
MSDESQTSRDDRNRFGIALVAAAALAILIVLFFYLFASGPRGTSRSVQLPFGPPEQAYASRITLGDFSMSRAENFVHQEVTMLSGVVANLGDRALGEMELTIEFRDALNQVVLRETRVVLGAQAIPLAPGQRRPFTISFEHIPADWNRQQPSVRVSGLRFA